MNIEDLYPETNIYDIYNNFLNDLKLSSHGKKTSLYFIKNKLSQDKSVSNKNIQVLVIGGTFARSGIVKKINENLDIENIENIYKPSFPTMESFLKFVAKECKDDITDLVINFADTIQPVYENGKMDGILIALTKENKMQGLLNKKIGEEIEKYFLKINKGKINVNVVNDTICLLLSGLIKNSYENIAGGIIGTGINIAFFLDKSVAINTEAGAFNNFIQSEPGKLIDKNSAEPGSYMFEKETSGGYLYKHFNFFIDKFNISYPKILDSSNLSSLSSKNLENVSRIAREVLDHSAILVGCQMAGLVSFLKKDLTFIMQGSVFWKGYGYKEKVIDIIYELAPEYRINFIKIPNDDILGAAKVIL